MKKLKRVLCCFLVMCLCLLSIKGLNAASCTIRISIYAGINAKSASAISGLGNSHAWIVIENMGSNTITIGTQSLSSGQSCTIGLFGNKTPKGIWYNIEAQDRNEGVYQDNSNTVYYQKIISGSSVISNIETVMNNNNYWGVLHNCAHFAVRIFNSVGGSTISTSADPAALRSRIMSQSTYGTGTDDPDFVNSLTTKKWYSVGAVTTEVTDEEILSGKIIDGDRIILIKDEELIFLDE